MAWGVAAMEEGVGILVLGGEMGVGAGVCGGVVLGVRRQWGGDGRAAAVGGGVAVVGLAVGGRSLSRVVVAKAAMESGT